MHCIGIQVVLLGRCHALGLVQRGGQVGAQTNAAIAVTGASANAVVAIVVVTDVVAQSLLRLQAQW